MKGKMLVALIAFAAAGPSLAAETAFDPKPLLDKAISKLKTSAYRSPQVDWPALEAKVRDAAKTAKDEIDLLNSLQLLVEGLGDGHSFIQTSAEYRDAFKERYRRDHWETGQPPKKILSQFMARKEPEARALSLPAAQAELIVVPKMIGGGEPARAYAEKLFGLVAGPSSRSCGYVLDLRGNTGGNVWPMVAGLSPFIGDGPGGRELYSDGRRSSYARLEKGAAIINEGQEGSGTEIVRIANWSPLPALLAAPVAVLTDDAVGSSGEGTAVQLKGRPNTRFFGQKTSGVASSNEGFELSEDINLVFTSGMMMDRNGNIYPDGIEPDETISAGEGSPADPDDAVVEAAKAWLASQKGCTKN